MSAAFLCVGGCRDGELVELPYDSSHCQYVKLAPVTQHDVAYFRSRRAMITSYTRRLFIAEPGSAGIVLYAEEGMSDHDVMMMLVQNYVNAPKEGAMR